jgi:hypothetical protein
MQAEEPRSPGRRDEPRLASPGRRSPGRRSPGEPRGAQASEPRPSEDFGALLTKVEGVKKVTRWWLRRRILEQFRLADDLIA